MKRPNKKGKTITSTIHFEVVSSTGEVFKFGDVFTPATFKFEELGGNAVVNMITTKRVM